MQTKISHIVDVTGHMTLRDNKRYQQLKKQDLQEVRQMQRVEMKEATEFFVRMKATREQNEKSFDEKMEVWGRGGGNKGREICWFCLSWQSMINAMLICVFVCDLLCNVCVC